MLGIVVLNIGYDLMPCMRGDYLPRIVGLIPHKVITFMKKVIGGAYGFKSVVVLWHDYSSISAMYLNSSSGLSKIESKSENR